MTKLSRQRVLAALQHKPVDRVPIFMWFHPETAERLASLLDIPPGTVPEAMGDDVKQTWVGNNYAMEGITHDSEGETHVDAWGIEWVRIGPFNQIRHSPLHNSSREEIARYQYPYQHIDQLLSNMDPLMAQAETVFVGCDISPCLFEMVFRLRGMEKTILDLVAQPDLSDLMIEQAANFATALAQAACDRFALDWLWTGDDVAGQKAMIMRPDSWRDRIRPHLERIFAVGKKRGLWVAYHSCGAIRSIIPDLVEMGLDVLNPIQCNCPGMDPLELKKAFGQHLTFMGGVDTHDLLPHGTADQVRRETARLLDGMMADRGGYIFAASHTIPPETPTENIFAMYEIAGVSRQEIFDRAATIRARIRSSI